MYSLIFLLNSVILK